jgi:TRAP-type C4-dicarboxylate transport system substrate-binding protein
VRAAADEAAGWYNAYIEEEEASILKDLESKGMTVIEIDRAPFKAKAEEVVEQFPELQPWYQRMVEAQS